MQWGGWSARARMALARRPWLYWALAACCTMAAGLQVHATVSDAEAARAAWGERAVAWVVAMPTLPGSAVPVEQRALPVALLPEGALDAVPDDAVAAHPLAAGAVLTATDLRRPGDVPDGWLVVAAPADRAPVVAAGQAVTLIGASGGRCDGMALAGTSGGAADGDVGSGTGTGVDVAVPPDCAPTLAADLLTGDVLLARLSG